MGVWRELSSSSEEEVGLNHIYNNVPVRQIVQEDFEDPGLTVEQLSFLHCGAEFVAMAGYLAGIPGSAISSEESLTCCMCSYCQWPSLGLLWFIQRWVKPFGYVSDCSLAVAATLVQSCSRYTCNIPRLWDGYPVDWSKNAVSMEGPPCEIPVAWCQVLVAAQLSYIL